MKPHHCQRGSGRRREHGHARDENHPRQSLRAWHSPDPHHRREGPAGQMMRHGEDRGERTIRRVRLAVDADLAEEHRLRADHLAVDDHGLTDFRCLRHGQIAGVDQMFGLEVNLELIRNAERIPRRGQRVQSMKEEEEANAGAADTPGVLLRFQALRLSADTRPDMTATLGRAPGLQERKRHDDDHDHRDRHAVDA